MFFLRSYKKNLAIHESREDFVPTKWIQTDDTYLEEHAQQKQVLKQVWFAGAHSDVGGGTLQHDLADISLVWMVVRLFLKKDSFYSSFPSSLVVCWPD